MDGEQDAVQRVQDILNQDFDDTVYSVEGGKIWDTVWVSGMNAHCMIAAKRMKKQLEDEQDISCGDVHYEGGMFGGVQFQYYMDTLER